MDIGSNSSGVAARLSNFTPRRFTFDGVECYSMEGLLQSFKFSKPHIQAEVCKLVGFGAKKRGMAKDWRKNQTLYWNGESFPRKSKQYQLLLNSAYDALFTNADFKKDLLSIKGASFTHSIGKRNESETVLTEREFCSRLTLLVLNGTCGENYVFPQKGTENQQEFDLV